MRVGKKSDSGISYLLLSLSGEVVTPLFFYISKGEKNEEVKLAPAEFLFQDKGECLLSGGYVGVIDLII